MKDTDTNTNTNDEAACEVYCKECRYRLKRMESLKKEVAQQKDIIEDLKKTLEEEKQRYKSLYLLFMDPRYN
jgi:predicted RNase H-like nuclease (RuvC/YqgF family)